MKEIDYKHKLKKHLVEKNFKALSKVKSESDLNSHLLKLNALIFLNMLFVTLLIYAQMFFDNEVTKIISFVGYSIAYLIGKEIYDIIKILKRGNEK